MRRHETWIALFGPKYTRKQFQLNKSNRIISNTRRTQFGIGTSGFSNRLGSVYGCSKSPNLSALLDFDNLLIRLIHVLIARRHLRRARRWLMCKVFASTPFHQRSHRSEDFSSVPVLLCAVGCGVDGLRGSELVLAAKAKAAEEKLNPTTELISVLVNEDGTNSTVVKPVSLLTGIPQKDYIYDPNLPRELKGFNLSDYPFYNAVPKDIEFACDGLHDGFYASIPHKCQVYHHCLFGTRYDFLCANYTAFDQKTFICHFVSEVDCKNSQNYYIRNEALYKQSETPAPSTTRAPTTTTTTTTTTTEAPPKKGGRRRRPYRRRRPVYEYYYDDEEEAYDEEYYDDDVDPPPRKANRRQQRPSGGRRDDPTTTTTTTTSTTTAAPASADAPLTRAPLSVYAPRALPKIKRPVPINEKSKYDYTTKAGAGVPAPTSNPKDGEDEEYYDDDEEYDEPQPPPSKRKESGKNGRRRNQHAERKRPMRYEDEYADEIEEEDERPRMRKGNNRKDDDFRGRNRGSQGKSKKGQREDDEPIPSERPGYVSPQRGGSRKRQPESSRPERRRPDRRPAKGYDYYDEEEPEEDVSRYSEERRRPNSRSKTEKPRSRPKKPTTTSTTTTSTTTTTTTTTTPRPTTGPTSSPPASYEDEEYEEYEYEDDIILDKPKDENRKEIPPTTPAPHRFSTTAYRTQRLPSPQPTTTEQSVKRGTPTFRSRKQEHRRPPSSDETFSSQVGTPTGFKRAEEDNSKVKSTEQNHRGSYDDESKRTRVPEFKSRRPVTGTGNSFSSEERRQVKPETSQSSVDSKSPTIRQEYPIPPAEVKPQGESQGFFIRKPFKPQVNSFSSKYLDDPAQRRPDSYDLPVSSPSALSAEDDLSYRKSQVDPESVDSEVSNLGSEDKKQRIEYPVLPPQITQGPPLPSPPQTSIYRRPYVPTGPEGPRRPNEESQYRRKKPDPFSTQADGNSRRQFPSSAEGNSNKEEEQSYRRQQKPSYTPTGPEAFRRPSGPDGTSKSSSNYRRTRPEKEQKKTLEELAYPSRRPVQTREPVTEPGPNYRNPFLNTRPVVEEPDYYKVNKEPELDFTAPGPSNDGSTQRPLSYDIGEEYDVTLNDALQPSTLNPTVQYSRVKTRGYQSAVTHPSYRSILVPAASQNYYSKTAVADQMEYETVVLPTARFTQAQARYKTPRRPNDWSYW